MGGDALVGLIGVLLGAVIGAWFTVRLPKAAAGRQVALQLMDQYISPEFSAVRGETWKIRYVWEKVDHSCLQFFVRRGFTNEPDTDRKCSNGLTPHQNLSRLLHFFAALSLYQEAGLVDARLLKILFEPHYQWYKWFFHEFMDEYRKEMPPHPSQADPVWLKALPQLEDMFARTAA